jgi:hypothetical protein
MRVVLGFPLLFCLLKICEAGPIDLGKVDLQKAPSSDEIRAPKNDDGIPTVGLMETVKAATVKDESKHVYFLVNPIGTAETAQKTWWVQREVTRDGAAIECECQFGEEDQGKGEYFAIVALVTGDSLEVGQTIEDLPKADTYSKVQIVKRS